MKLISEYPFSSRLVLRMHEMDNGLRVLLLRDPAAPLFAYQTWFRVGSRHEEEGKTGMAHLFEHLMFKATEHHPPGEFDRLFELRGGHTNAATWVDWTYYQDDLPKGDLDLAVTLEADRMAHLLLTPDQVEPEREVVMNERLLRVEDDVDGFLSEELFRLAFERHPYHWPTIGWMRDIKAITLEDAVRFYRTYYAPNNATVIVVGDIEERPTLELIARHYGSLRPQPIPREERASEPEQREERRATYQKPVATDRLLLGYKAPGFLDPEHLRLQVLSDVLLGGFSSQLYRDLVVEREIASSASGMVTPFRDPGLWEIGVSLQRGHAAAEAEALIDQHIAAVCAAPLSEEAVERSKARFLMHFYADLRTAHGKAEALGHFETTGGDYRRLFAVPEALRAITAADLLTTARRFLRKEARTVLYAHPSDPDAAPAPGEEVEHLPGPVHRSPVAEGGGR